MKSDIDELKRSLRIHMPVLQWVQKGIGKKKRAIESHIYISPNELAAIQTELNQLYYR